MKRVIGLLIISLIVLTGCGVDETWNGVYSNNSENSVLIYVNNTDASVMIRQKGENYTFYPIQYENYFNVAETKLTTKNGETVTIEKVGKTITIKFDGEEKGVWANLEGTYTKYKNIKSYNENNF